MQICFLVKPPDVITSSKEKEGDQTQSDEKKTLYQQKIRKQMDNRNTPPKLRLHNDCGPN